MSHSQAFLFVRFRPHIIAGIVCGNNLGVVTQDVCFFPHLFLSDRMAVATDTTLKTLDYTSRFVRAMWTMHLYTG